MSQLVTGHHSHTAVQHREVNCIILKGMQHVHMAAARAFAARSDLAEDTCRMQFSRVAWLPPSGECNFVYQHSCIQGTSRLTLADQSTCSSDLIQGLVDDAHAGDAALQHQGLPLLPLAGLIPTGPLRHAQHCLAGRRQGVACPLSILQGGAGLSLVQHSLTVFGPAGRQLSSCKTILAKEVCTRPQSD